jgi:polar amino acid transport system permease protein
VGYEFDWSVVLQPRLWLLGLSVTLCYAIVTTLLGLLIGVICGILSLSKSRFIKFPVHVYVQFFRCTPLLVQIIWFYYALPMISGIGIPAWMAAGLGLTLYMGSFSAEIFRGGVISIDLGQWQASKAIGMSYAQMMWNVILPQAVRRMIPPVVNQSVMQLKNTSLLYVIAVPDLMYTSADLASSTYRPLEIYTTVALIYFALLYPLTHFAQRLENRADR